MVLDMTSKNMTSKNILDKDKISDNNNIKEKIKTILQFGCWYLFIHTCYWGLEQFKYKWCVSHGFSGYIHSLIFSQSHMCIALGETTKILSNHQLTSFGTICSFIGLKTFY